MNPNKGYEFKSSRNGRLKRVRGALFAGILLTGSACSGSDGESLTGGCDVFRVYAQNRYAPLGAAVRAEPTTPDPTGLARDGGAPASTAPDCRGEYHPQ